MSEYSLIDLLWKMKRGELLLENYGICHHLTMYCADYRERRQAKKWMQEWPEYAGHASYPVPAGGCDPECAYDDAMCNGTLWAGEYGASRKRLLNYLITRYEADEHA